MPAVGNPDELVLQYLQPPNPAAVQNGPQQGQQVVTAGFKSGPLESYFPPNIPIGRVLPVDENQLLNNGTIQVSPQADLRGVDVVQILTRPTAGTERAQVPVTLSNAVKLSIRLVLLGFFGVVIQESAVSQISIFGVSADLTPLIVMAVGLLCGSLTGAVFGFATGLLIDLILVQTLGVTSLLYIAIGYWAGRLRELRDPSHELVPLAVGAFAAAFAGLGMAVIQFLLGVDAPVSVLLLQQIFVVVLVDTLLALPVYALVRRILRPVLPEDPRRRRRRAYTTGGLSPLQQGAARRGSITRPKTL